MSLSISLWSRASRSQSCKSQTLSPALHLKTVSRPLSTSSINLNGSSTVSKSLGLHSHSYALSAPRAIVAPASRSLATSAPAVLLPKDVDLKELYFKEPRRTPTGSLAVDVRYHNLPSELLRVQTPPLRIVFDPHAAPIGFGGQQKESDEGRRVWRLSLAFDNLDEEPDKQEFFDFVEKLNERVIQTVQEHPEWLDAKKKPLPEVVKFNFKSSLRSSDAKYSPILNLKMNSDLSGTPMVSVYSADKSEIPYKALRRGDIVKAIVAPTNVWAVSASGWGVSWKVYQIKVEQEAPPTSKLDSYSFV